MVWLFRGSKTPVSKGRKGLRGGENSRKTPSRQLIAEVSAAVNYSRFTSVTVNC